MTRWKIIKNTFYFLLLLSVLFRSDLTFAEKIVIDSENLYNYANNALQDKDYGRAINEFKKFLYYFPNDKRSDLVKYNIALASYLSGSYERSGKIVQKYINNALKNLGNVESKESIIFKSFILLVRCFEKQGKIQLAVNELRNLSMLTDKTILKDLIYYEAGLIFFRNGLFLKAQLVLKKISKDGQQKYNISKLNTSLINSDDIPSKSPALAGFLSIVPGGGYLYTERYRDALVSFVFNGLMIYAAYEAFDSGNEGLGAILSFVETGFYFGNIYGSYNSAKKYNRYMKDKFIEREQAKYRIGLYPNKQNNTFMLGVLLTF